MSQIGAPKRIIIAEPMFEPIPGVQEPEIPELTPETVEEPQEVPDGR